MTAAVGAGALRWAVPLLASCWIGALPTAALGADVAMVTDVQGSVTESAGGRPVSVTILAPLTAGAQVELAPGATLVALYLDAGDEYAFRGPATVVFRSGQPEVLSGAKPEKRSALGKSGKDIRIKPVGMAQAAIVMRGARGSARLRLLNLQQTHTLEARPEFRWQELQPGLTYEFKLSDDTGRALLETQVRATSLLLPVEVQLNEGVPYTWEVSALLPDGRKYSSSADFAVAPADVRARAETLRPAPSAPLSSRVAYAAWLDQMELGDEAHKYWQAASAERPEDPRLKALAAR